jgi:hypothetical protein
MERFEQDRVDRLIDNLAKSANGLSAEQAEQLRALLPAVLDA